jgi:hypothetical protein
VTRIPGILSATIFSVTALFPATRAAAQVQQATRYRRLELSIPMRDGVHLFAVALVPQHAGGSLPILLIRTPFDAAREFHTAELPARYRELAKDGYIFVTEDIRGRSGSGGVFVTNRPQHDPNNTRGTDESTDAYDTIDWLVKHLPGNDGKVGVLGISYRGWLAALAGVNHHPAVKAISPQAPTTDTWMGDDFFHQGAFRETQGVTYAALVEGTHGLSIPDADQFDFYLRLETLDSIAKVTGVSQLPSWVAFRNHPAYDRYWQSKALERVLTKPEVPILFVGGWWDQEDILGPELAYHIAERADTHGWNHIVLGPWFHGGWAQPGGDSLGPISLGSNTADYFRAAIERPWFAYYLHGKGDGHLPAAWAFETGENRWHTFDAWPPRSSKTRNLYLSEGGMLSFDQPSNVARGRRAMGENPDRTPDYDAYVSDPAHPVPFMPRPDGDIGWPTWLEQDQRFLKSRSDVVTWESEALGSDLTIAGDVVAHLFASTTGTDADWVVKLIDVYPDNAVGRPAAGYQLMVNADIMRGRYWKSFSEATPIVANTVTPFTVDMHEQLYRFLKGHRLMVEIQSSWFPLYDRNPQTFVPNIFDAKARDFRAATQRIWHTPRYPSHLEVRVLP